MQIKDLVRPDSPLKGLSFWRGFDMFGTLRGLELPFDMDGDAAAIQRDWEVIGRDMQRAIDQFVAK